MNTSSGREGDLDLLEIPTLTSGCAALLSAPSDAAWPPRSGCWPAPSGERAASPQPSSRSTIWFEEDKRSPNRKCVSF